MREIQKRARTGIGIIIVVTVFLMLFARGPASFFIVFAGLFVGVIYISVQTKKLRKVYKETIVTPVLEGLFPGCYYDHGQGFDKGYLGETRLFSMGNRYSSSDYLKGTYKGIDFEFADVYIANEVRTNKSTVTTVYFRGQWLVVTPKKTINSKLYVIDRDNHYSSPKGWIFGGRDLEKVELESIKFNDLFKVFASEPHDAFYILTPPLIEKLLMADNRDISMYQDRSSMHIALRSNADLLEPKLFTAIDVEVEKQKVAEQMHSMLSVLDVIVLQSRESEGESWNT